jgi:hypothetical protein
MLLGFGLGGQNDEFVSAEAIDRVGCDRDLRDALSNFDEDGVADCVSISVVDPFEPVEVDEDDSDRRCALGLTLILDRVEESLSITQSCERVRHRLPREFSFGPLARGDILELPNDDVVGAVRAWHHHRVTLHPNC